MAEQPLDESKTPSEKQFEFMYCFGCMMGHIHELKDGWWYCSNCEYRRQTSSPYNKKR